MRPGLDARGIKIVTVCADDAERIRKGRRKHGLAATMLADPDLAITDRFNLRNRTNLSPRGVRPLPIPTTILVDADGVVRWIDQGTDYQARSHPDHVMAAIHDALD